MIFNMQGAIIIVIKNYILTNCLKSTTKRLILFFQSRFGGTDKDTYFKRNDTIQFKYMCIRRFKVHYFEKYNI